MATSLKKKQQFLNGEYVKIYNRYHARRTSDGNIMVYTINDNGSMRFAFEIKIGENDEFIYAYDFTSQNAQNNVIEPIKRLYNDAMEFEPYYTTPTYIRGNDITVHLSKNNPITPAPPKEYAKEDCKIVDINMLDLYVGILTPFGKIKNFNIKLTATVEDVDGNTIDVKAEDIFLTKEIVLANGEDAILP